MAFPCQELEQVVGHDDAPKIHEKLSKLLKYPLEKAQIPLLDEYGDEIVVGTNEIYILALSTALQRAQHSEPSGVEARVRQVLQQLGLCLEACQTYFIPSRTHSAAVHEA
jgi:hypothetical protein